jgi:16S rRNA C967 or C1407 C5-methylase (RsmB/RsmF family)
MTCVEIRCRDCDVVISTCSCPGEKTVYLQQCRDCESEDIAAEARAKAAREATKPGVKR